LCNTSQIKRHEVACDGNLKVKTIFTGTCCFCGKSCSNSNSQRNHERLCRLNPLYQNNIKHLKNRNYSNREYSSWQKKPENKEKYLYWLEKITNFNKSDYKKIKSKETYAKNKPFHKKYIMSVENRSHLSGIRSKAIEEKGNGGFLDVKYYTIKNINDVEFKVRGTWELKYALFLNSIGILWIRKVYIKYITSDTVIRTYTPDFYLPHTRQYIEIKGYFSEKDIEKIKLVEKQNNIKINVLKLNDLKSLGIKI